MHKRGNAGKTRVSILAILTLVAVVVLAPGRFLPEAPAATPAVAVHPGFVPEPPSNAISPFPAPHAPPSAPHRPSAAPIPEALSATSAPSGGPSHEPWATRLPPPSAPGERSWIAEDGEQLPRYFLAPARLAGYLADPPRQGGGGKVLRLETPGTAANFLAPRLALAAEGGPELKTMVPEPLNPASFGSDPSSPGWSVERELERLARRLDELETSRIAHEDATRTIIRRSFAERGSNINEYVIFGGTLEVLTGWDSDFDGVEESFIRLDTAELDFEIQVNDWTFGSIIFEYIDGTNILFPTTQQDEALVDRMNVDTAFITIGDLQRCPIFATFGRIVVPFGISTGDPVADVLTIEDPLTVEVFETKEDVILLGFEIIDPPPFPPSLRARAPLINPYPVKPLVIHPILRGLGLCTARCAGYPPIRPPVLVPAPKYTPASVIWRPRRSFNGAIYGYNGDTFEGDEDHIEHMGGTLGYRARGLLRSKCIPWSVDVNVDVNSSVFDSMFLEFEYRHFLDQIGYVPGMASHVRSSVGPVAFVVEWNGALQDATFTDDLARAVSIAPSAWQVSFAYQFGWNPTVEVIGAQGTYFTIAYSESQDLAGVARVIGPDTLRVGFVPERRFLVGFGEWIWDGLRLAIEYSHLVDYSVAEGGTGHSADGVFAQLTYEW